MTNTITGGLMSAYLALGSIVWGVSGPPPGPVRADPAVAIQLSEVRAPTPPDLSIEMIQAAVAAQDESNRQAALDAFLAAMDAFLRSLTPPPPPATHKVSGGWQGCHAPMTADPDEMRAIVIRAAEQVGVDPAKLVRIPPRESGWNPDTQNCSSGACGLFQHLPSYWPGRAEEIGLPEADCRDPWANALAAAMLFKRAGYSPWAPSGPY